MAGPKGIEFTGLRETNLALRRLGVTDPAIKQAMTDAGMIVMREAWKIGPSDSGKLLSTLKVTGGKNKLQVQVGNNTTAQYGWTFHANATRYNYAKGRMTFHVPTHTRKGSRRGARTQVAAYSTVRRIRSFPFLFIAFERKSADLYRAYVTALDKLFREFGRG